ncbi:FecCD family ABC transporter permease [Streptomyces sp. NPDC050560]|uniref:FecCD family ABC transporter permease n=1 Tax=Streptomyces sp. NPDC050560 TaxID=3365630 RepID=UPI0037A93854
MNTAATPRRPVLRLGRGAALRLRPRAVLVTALLAAGCALCGLLSLLLLGTLSPAAALHTLSGHGDRLQELVLYRIEAPRTVGALVAGLALGAAGAVFQSVTRNPLGSPDLLGFTGGASAGATAVIALLHGGAAAVAGGALCGAFATALVVFLCTAARGVGGHRVVVVGIGANAMAYALTDYFLSRAGLEDAAGAQLWLTGGLAGATWEQVLPAGLALPPLLAVLLSLTRPLDLLEMGDDGARGLGVEAGRTRAAALLLAVALVGAGVCVAGPVPFVALAAPPLARRLTGSPGTGVLPAALTGALALLLADAVCRAPGVTLPTGVVTGAVGGAFLAWLLLAGPGARGRRGRAGAP